MELLKDQPEQEKLRPLKIWPRLSLNRFVLLENVELTFSDGASRGKLNESNASKDLPFYFWLSFSYVKVCQLRVFKSENLKFLDDGKFSFSYTRNSQRRTNLIWAFLIAVHTWSCCLLG